MIFIIRNVSGKVLHLVDVGDRRVPLYPADLSGCDLSNLNLNGAELSWANLERCNLRGTKLREANLFHANLRDAIVDYADLRDADLSESNLEGAIMWPSNTLGAKFFGATITPNSEISEHARLAIVDARRHLDGFTRLRSQNSTRFREFCSSSRKLNSRHSMSGQSWEFSVWKR